MYVNVLVLAIIHNLEQHVSLVLIEVFWSRVYCHEPSLKDGRTVIVCSGVWSAHDHDGGIPLEETKVADGGFKEVTVLLQPEGLGFLEYG